MEGSETTSIEMYNDCYYYVKACLLGDGSLTLIKKGNGKTAMLSFTHGIKQKPWLQSKVDSLCEMMGRHTKTVRQRSQFDARTNKTYLTCQSTLTSTEFVPIYEVAYPNGKKTFTKELLRGLEAKHLAVFWADDGNLEPKRRIGRLNMYEPEDQCLLVSDWIESLCGAKGRYEDYEKAGVGRLRFPAKEMAKIAVAIKPYLHETMLYKIDMQYKNNTRQKALLAASSPNMTVEDLPELNSMTYREWGDLAKSLGVSSTRNGTKESLRQRILDIIVDDKEARAQSTATL